MHLSAMLVCSVVECCTGSSLTFAASFHATHMHVIQEIASSLARARTKTKPPPQKTGQGDDQDDQDDATAQELGLNAEVGGVRRSYNIGPVA